jgi:hypothetical protein
MKNILRLLKQKSTWAGIAAIGTGAVLLINGDTTTGVQTIIGGLSVIFIREAIAGKDPSK